VTELLVACRDPVSRIALGALAPGVAFADPAQAVAMARTASPAAILVDADEPGAVMLVAALTLAAAAPVFAFATAATAEAPLLRAGARTVLRKPTGLTVLPGHPVLAAWHDAIAGAA
jgi:CheY-like chemotaxis protein